MSWETVPTGLGQGRAVRVRRSSAPAAAARRSEPEPACVELFGIPFASITQDGLVDQIERLIESGGSHWVVTANIQHVGMAARDPEFLRTLRSADLVTADGTPICWAARIRRSPLPARVTGSDLVVPLARRCEERGWRLMLMGGDAGVAFLESAARVLDARFLDEAVRGARQSLELTTNQYKGGIVSYLNVIVAQTIALSNERTALNVQGRRFLASVQLVRAVGGGWDARSLEDIRLSGRSPAGD